MAQEKQAIQFENELGKVEVHQNVFEAIARKVVEEIKEVSIVDSSFNKGITCHLDKNGLIKMAIDIKVAYGHNADRLSRKIQEQVYTTIKNQTDMSPDQVDVNVVGFQFK